ncbi:hypothetical protein SCP_1700890 [Sparassis crispa]|uniref:Uncharacterized protein n=1 Tax=Sparassis crispa TaxID=139825 RepID=A0A401H5R5_9APHY|nr:hypothetical protein SCP_1700890 [Sparassis crispa]GBE89764.1 hypothetical protein SCP_1700890 [Sparassis crispa]
MDLLTALLLSPGRVLQRALTSSHCLLALFPAARHCRPHSNSTFVVPLSFGIRMDRASTLARQHLNGARTCLTSARNNLGHIPAVAVIDLRLLEPVQQQHAGGQELYSTSFHKAASLRYVCPIERLCIWPRYV